MQLATPEQIIALWRRLESDGVYPYEPSEDKILAIAGPQVGLVDLPRLAVDPGPNFPTVLQRTVRRETESLASKLAAIVGTKQLETHVWQPLANTHQANVFCRFDPTQGSRPGRVMKALGLWAVAPVQITVGMVPIVSTRMAVREDHKLALIDLRVADFRTGSYINIPNPALLKNGAVPRVLLLNEASTHYTADAEAWCCTTVQAYLTENRVIHTAEVIS